MTDYFIKANGNDDKDGLTDATAWQSVDNVRKDNLEAGDSAFFKCGDTWEKQQIFINWSGLPTKKSIVGAYHDDGVIGVKGNKPVLDGLDEYPSSYWNALIVGYKVNHVEVENFRTINSEAKGINMHDGIDLSIRGMEISNVLSAAISFIRVKQGLIESNDATDCGRNRIENPGTNYPATIGAHRECDGITIRGNNVHQNYGEGIGCYHWSKNVLIENNVCYDNKVNIYLTLAQDMVVRHNLIYRTDKFHDAWPGEGRGILAYCENSYPDVGPIANLNIYGNLIARCGTGIGISPDKVDSIANNVNFFNNTIVDNEKNFHASEAAADRDGDFIDCKMFNNIFWAISDDSKQVNVRYIGKTDGLIFDNNLWSSAPEYSVGIGPNDLPYAIPLLKKSSGWDNLQPGELSAADFALQPGSPAIGAGMDLSNQFTTGLDGGSVWPNNVIAVDMAGRPWDIGAVVYSGDIGPDPEPDPDPTNYLTTEEFRNRIGHVDSELSDIKGMFIRVFK